MKRPEIERSQSAYGTYDEMIGILRDQLSKGPYMLGERMTALDLLWGMAFRWTLMFGLVAERAGLCRLCRPDSRAAACPQGDRRGRGHGRRTCPSGRACGGVTCPLAGQACRTAGQLTVPPRHARPARAPV